MLCDWDLGRHMIPLIEESSLQSREKGPRFQPPRALLPERDLLSEKLQLTEAKRSGPSLNSKQTAVNGSWFLLLTLLPSCLSAPPTLLAGSQLHSQFSNS